MNLQRGYGLARASFEKKSNLHEYVPKEFQILTKNSNSELELEIIQELFFSMQSGALCLELSFLEHKLHKKLEITEEIIKSLEDKNIILKENRFYFKNIYETESRIVEKISLLLQIPNSEFKFFSSDDGLNYSEEQISAIQNTLKQSFSIITGGPGTGKTTLIRQILLNLIKNGYESKKLCLASPTGKAAKRLSESLNNLNLEIQTPQTLHRLLGYNPNTGKFFYNEENPLPFDVLLIDEASMIDFNILDALLRALLYTPKLKLILVGDPDQLLSVNKGAIFSDLVSLNINVSKITKTYRQKQEAIDLIQLIESIRKENAGFLTQYKVSSLEDSEKSVIWIETQEKNKFYEFIKSWYSKHRELNSQILTPFNNGWLGVEKLNSFLNEEFPEYSPPRILNTNLPNLELFNGETGFIIEQNGEYMFTKHLNEPGVWIPFYALRYFSYAYVITIHKSQGSEYDHVCLVLPPLEEKPLDEIFTKRLLYTAVTRGKKSITILGSYVTWKEALSKVGYPRMSGLQGRVKN